MSQVPHSSGHREPDCGDTNPDVNFEQCNDQVQLKSKIILQKRSLTQIKRNVLKLLSQSYCTHQAMQRPGSFELKQYPGIDQVQL